MMVVEEKDDKDKGDSMTSYQEYLKAKKACWISVTRNVLAEPMSGVIRLSKSERR